MIVTLRTDNPVAELGIFDKNGTKKAYLSWEGHRELSNTLLLRYKELLKRAGIPLDEVTGAVFYKGPGSFTGLRIGAAFINALEVPVVNINGDQWEQNGVGLLTTNPEQIALPEYGREPHITKQKK